MPWKSFLKNYFSFSRSERYGILGLCGCILLVIVIRLLLPHLIKNDIPDTTSFENEIALFRKSIDSAQVAKVQPVQYDIIREEREFFYFDPNHATDEEWVKLGLNNRQIQNIHNYLAKGGKFKRKEDFQKLYTIPATQYSVLEPYIRIPSSGASLKPAETAKVAPVTASEKEPVNVATTKYSEKKAIPIELNAADSSMLMQLSGIGPVLAARIIKYRTRIGGYAEVTQLGEVYGIKPELVEKLTPQLSIDKLLIRKMSINTATFKDLISHPYLNEQQTKGILNYKKLQGRINGLDELVRNNILTREDADRIEPYVSFE